MSLAQLSVTSSSTRETSKPEGTISYAAACSDGRGGTGPPADNTHFKSSAKETSVHPHVPSEFHIGQHVKFYNKKGEIHHGEICWTGRGIPHGLEYNVVGIKTVSLIKNIIGMSF